MAKMYDVYFTLEHPAVVLLEADSKEEIEDILLDMDDDELLERIKNAIDFMGVRITNIEEVD